MSTENNQYLATLYIEGYTDQVQDIKPRDWFPNHLEKVVYFWGRNDASEGKEMDDINNILNKITNYDI